MRKSVASVLSVLTVALASGAAVEQAVDVGTAMKLLKDNDSVRQVLSDQTPQIFASEGRGGGGIG